MAEVWEAKAEPPAKPMALIGPGHPLRLRHGEGLPGPAGLQGSWSPGSSPKTLQSSGQLKPLRNRSWGTPVAGQVLL